MKEQRGVLGQFGEPEKVVEAAKKVRGAGAWRVDAYSPFSVHGLAEAVDGGPDLMAPVVFCGGFLGCVGGYFLQYYAAVLDYPINVGNRPLHSWPAFVPVTFELTILLASLCAFFGVFALSGLPRLNHPVFNVDAFRRASRDKFFVLLAGDEGFDAAAARRALKDAGAEEVYDVAP